MIPKFSLALLLALALLVAPTSASQACPAVYAPVCCWVSSAAGLPMTQSSRCVCENRGGFVIFPRECGPMRVPAGRTFRMPVAAPVAAPAAPSVARDSLTPVCCDVFDFPRVMQAWECKINLGHQIPLQLQYCHHFG